MTPTLRWLLGFVLITLMVWVSGSQAFHENVGECKEGDIGYLAAVLDEEGRFLGFLSSARHPTPGSIICQIDPDQWIKVLGRAKRV